MNEKQGPCSVGGPSRAYKNPLHPYYTTNLQTPEKILERMLETAKRRPHGNRDDCIEKELLALQERWEARS